MIDFYGRRSERLYLHKGWYDSAPYRVQSISLGDIANFSVTKFGNGGGLYAEPEFMKRARQRGFAVINADRLRYEYAVA